MNPDRDIGRRLTDLYSSEANLRAPDRVLADALETIDNTSQRRRLIGVRWRLPNLNSFTRLALALVVIAASGIGVALFRPAGPGPAALASPSPTSSPSALPTPDSSGFVGPLDGGRYALAGFPVQASFEVPAGWSPCFMGPYEEGVCGPESSSSASYPSFTFLIIENVVADPCEETLLDPPVGPTVDELVDAISSLKGFHATPPIEVVVDGYPGRQFEVGAPAAPSCDLKTWATSDRVNGVGPGETNVLRVVDLDGARVLIAAAYFPALNPPETRSVLDAIAASIQFGP
ncbi:MAG: hypothetical protein ACJ765_12025 [Chloroflexota bacterium]